MSTPHTPVHVAVIGAVGQTGKPLVRALSRRGARVRALVHRMHPDHPETPDGVDAVAVELSDRRRLSMALEGVAVAYYIPPVFNGAERRFGANVIAAARAVQLPRLVYHSVLHAATPAMPHHQRKSLVEVAVRESPLAWTIIQPAMYAQTPLAFLNTARTTLTVGFDSQRPFTPIDLEDLAEAAATVLLECGHEYATYELAGTERLDFVAMAAAMSRVLGHEVVLRSVPAVVVAAVAALRLGPRALLDMRAMLNHYDAYGLVGNATVVRMLLRREPTPFAEVMRRELGGTGAS